MDNHAQGEVLRSTDYDGGAIGELRTDLRRLRRCRRLSQRDVGKLLGVSQATISAFELGSDSRMRQKTVASLRRLVLVWKRDDEERGVEALSEQESGGFPGHGSDGPSGTRRVCAKCHCGLPVLAAPIRFCPSCGHSALPMCHYCNGAIDLDANFCACCGRAAGNDIGDIQYYDLLDRSDERFRIAVLHAVLKMLDENQALSAILQAVHAATGSPMTQD